MVAVSIDGRWRGQSDEVDTLPPWSTRSRKVLVANRGEIARRIFRTLRTMGLASVAVYSDADADAPHVADADEAVRIGAAPSRESYLAIDRLIDAARNVGADAVHPGYGFLSENADFAARCADAGLTFIGPPVEAIRTMGSKIEAKAIMAAAGVPVVPGVSGVGLGDNAIAAEARKLGLPILIKASAGGGGKGMRIVRATELRRRAPRARREGERVRRRHAPPRALLRPPAAHRDPDPRRHARQRGPLLRARVLDPAPVSEDHRGGAVARRRRHDARAHGRGRGRCGESDRLRRRRHGRVHRRSATARSTSSR